MKLQVKERLVLLNLLPGESNFATWKTINAIREKLFFSEKESKALAFRTEPCVDKDWSAFRNYLTDKIAQGNTGIPDMGSEYQNTLQEFDKHLYSGPQQTLWDEKADKEIDVPIGELATEVIKAQLDKIAGTDWSPDIWWFAPRLVDGGVDVTASIVKALKKLDDDGKLREWHLPLYERFVENKKD